MSSTVYYFPSFDPYTTVMSMLALGQTEGSICRNSIFINFPYFKITGILTGERERKRSQSRSPIGD